MSYRFEGVELRGNEKTADRVILRYLPFEHGQTLYVDDPELERARYRLLGTGFFSDVQLSLRRGDERGSAVLVVEVEERNTVIVQNLWMGIAADEDDAGNAEPISAYVGIKAAETNLAGTGITLGGGLGLAADQLSLRAEFADPSFLGSNWTAHVHLAYIDGRDFFGSRDVIFESPFLEQRAVTDNAVVAFERLGGSLGGGRELGLNLSFDLSYRLESVSAIVPPAASHLRGDRREPIDFDILPGDSVLSSLEGKLVFDTRNALILPTDGSYATLGLSGGVAPLGSDYSFQKLEIGAQHWFPLPFGHVLRLEGFAGGIAGDAPFFEQYYIGDFSDLLPDRILGLNPDRRKAPNLFDTSILEVRYGEYAAMVQGEYRIPIYEGRGAIYAIDFFAATGLFAVATQRQFEDPPAGYEGAALIPIDLTYNLGLRADTSIGGATLAFSNLLGLLPARGGR